jgi:hypothetical protein
MNYQKIYDQIIERALFENRIKNSSVYYEKHHILPRCLGGNNEIQNLVLLTAREHFLCHWLLCEIYPNNGKLAIAFFRMCNSKKHKNRYTPSSRVYAYSRFLFSESIKGDNNIAKRPEVRKKHSENQKGKKFTDEHKQKLALSKIGKKRPDVTESNKLRILSDETKLKISESKKGKRLGISPSNDTKIKMSESRKKYWETKKSSLL